MDLNAYQQRAEEFLIEIGREYYTVGSGQKDRLEIAGIYDRYADLFTEEAVRGLLDRMDGKETRYLAEFAVGGYLDNRVKALSEEITNAELSTTVAWDGEDVPYQQVPVLLRNEPDRSRRSALGQRYYSRMTEVNPLRADRWSTLHDEAQRLGFADYVELCDELRSLDLQKVAGQMRRFLDETEAVFEPRLAQRLEAIGVPRDEAHVNDVARLFRADEFDPLFPAERMVDALRRTLAGMGIALDAQPNLILDLEMRPLKSPRAFCSSVRVPDEVYLVIKPQGGQDDYGSLLHEAGHAEHYTHVERALPFAYRYLGDNSVTESYAFLFDHLLDNRHWLQEILGVSREEADAYVRFSLFQKLWFVRRYGAKINYELELHRGAVNGQAENYTTWLKRAGHIRVPPERYLSDVDDAFYVAQYLRAWMLEIQWRNHLERTYGPDWYNHRRAGEFIISQWRLGQRDNADQMAARLGSDGLDVTPLIEEVLSAE
jgi:hypothetical protein